MTLPDDAGSLVRCCIAALHITAGTLILTRSPAGADSNWKELAWCLPSLLASGWVFHFAQPTDQWNVGPKLLFATSTLFSIWSLLCLGKSFAVFPSIRNLRSNGPYGVVRHPVYAGEIGLLLSCAWFAWNQSVAWLALCFALISIVIRIVVEEKKLECEFSYRQYQARVRWRLLPFIW